MSVFIGYPSFMAYQMMKGKKGNNDGFPSIPGIVARYSASGLTNEQMAANPVWVDKTGNGHDIQLKNFSWKGMSGIGGYGDENHQTFYKFTLDDYVFIATPPGVKHMNFTFRVTGLQPGNKLTLAFFGTTNTVYGTWDKDGIYTVDADIVEAGKPTYFYNGYGATRGEFTIEILPLYPGALVFDGVDNYGTCDNFPILTKEKGYTVVALRQWITRGKIAQGLVSNVKNWLKDGAFLLEYRNIQAEHLNKPISFGAIGSEMDLPHILTYQTSKSYNGVSITTGNFEGTDVLHVGKLAPTNVGTCINAAIWELVFLDHDATEEELTKIKDYFVKTYPWLFSDQAWTVVGKTNEDEDFPRYSFSDPSFVELLNSEEWTYPEGEQPVINPQFSRLLALDALDLEANSEINTYNLTPSEALQVKERHPKWKIGIDVVKGHRYQYGEDLWEVLQGHKTQENWKPSLETASLWKRVDEEHAGTKDDPIPYAPPMEIFKDKYYTQSKVLYKCIRDSGQPLSHNLSDLVGNYVEKA